MMAGGGGSGGESEEVSEPEYNDPLAGLTQEEIESRWNAVIDYLETHPRENYPQMTDEAYCEMCEEAYLEIMYEGINLE